jgi:hypothetical protein
VYDGIALTQETFDSHSASPAGREILQCPYGIFLEIDGCPSTCHEGNGTWMLADEKGVEGEGKITPVLLR